jgi:hypothetical protein
LDIAAAVGNEVDGGFDPGCVHPTNPERMASRIAMNSFCRVVEKIEGNIGALLASSGQNKIVTTNKYAPSWQILQNRPEPVGRVESVQVCKLADLPTCIFSRPTMKKPY